MTARHIFSDLANLEQRLADRYVPLEGTLRVATTDTLAASVLPRHLAAFRIQHPGIVLELVISNPVSNLTHHDADVAVWPMMARPEVLVGQRMCGIAYATYAVSGRETGPWLVPDEALAGSVVGRWARIHLPTEQIAARADSLLALRDLATAGMGRVVLPCYLGDATLHLNRVSPVLLEVTSELWLLTHKDLRRNAAVATFTRFMKCSLADDQDLLEGRCPT